MYFGFGGNVLRILQTSMKLYADHLHNLIKPSERVAGWIHRCETPQCSPLTQQISRLRQGTSALSDDGDMMPHATSRKEATNAVLHERLQVAYYCADTESFSRRCLPIRGLFSIHSRRRIPGFRPLSSNRLPQGVPLSSRSPSPTDGREDKSS